MSTTSFSSYRTCISKPLTLDSNQGVTVTTSQGLMLAGYALAGDLHHHPIFDLRLLAAQQAHSLRDQKKKRGNAFFATNIASLRDLNFLEPMALLELFPAKDGRKAPGTLLRRGEGSIRKVSPR